MSGLARLQLARALALSGDTVKAKKAYDDLFILWKDADVEVPVIKQARAEFDKLSRE
jgi:eukaryotic-like serine/threonine-protein kinase